MDTWIHKPTGEFIPDDPYYIGREVIRKYPGSPYVAEGAVGVIIQVKDNERVRVDWGSYGKWNTKKSLIGFVNG